MGIKKKTLDEEVGSDIAEINECSLNVSWNLNE